ncbi:hypothetical protein P7H22_11815 [Paenibacillus larvae]|nr:hypothetical protein [Paenibacillus larvae]MDT2240903.1 hypothetical protein [Paenibacillus larvae]
MIQFVQMTLTPTVRQHEQEMNRNCSTVRKKDKPDITKFNLGALYYAEIKARRFIVSMSEVLG